MGTDFSDFLFGLFTEIESVVKKNKELNKEIVSTNNKARDSEENLRKDLQSRETAISGLEQCIQDMQKEIGELNNKVSNVWNGACGLAAIAGVTIRVPCHIIKSLQLI